MQILVTLHANYRSSSSLSDVMESFQDQLNLQDVDLLADRLRFVDLCICILVGFSFTEISIQF